MSTDVYMIIFIDLDCIGSHFFLFLAIFYPIVIRRMSAISLSRSRGGTELQGLRFVCLPLNVCKQVYMFNIALTYQFFKW